MGRFITGDWEYKFAFARQSSSFGEIIEELSEKEDSGMIVERFIGQSGEIVELTVENGKRCHEILKEYAGDIDIEGNDLDWTENHYDRYMIALFMKENDFKNSSEDHYENMTFRIEY